MYKERTEFLILLDPNLFLKISAEAVDEIFVHVENLNQTDPQEKEEIIWTLEGNPLFIIPVEIVNHRGLDLNDPLLISQLREFKNLKILKLVNPWSTLNLEKERRKIEEFIVSFQVSEFMEKGVVFEDLNNFYIEGLLPIGENTRVSTGVVIKGDSQIGRGVSLYPNTYIENSIINDNCVLLPGCVVRESILEKDVQIGPYTHLRNGALVKQGAKMGNFVEMKKSILGKGSKSMHLTYIGDAEIGEGVNIGAGTITCNYDGSKKNKTIIEDNVFVGSGSELVAPVTVKKNSYIGAGSTITKDVPEDSLGLAREKQRNIIDWVKSKKRIK
jgi:bifunctional UDP-N-acetylglucosamine pyrophosphorylase/glucosamine-1-phosphate N-acetyltransferase